MKSFTFSTTGHRYVQFQANSSINGANSITVDSTAYPEILYAKTAIDQGLNCKYWLNTSAGASTFGDYFTRYDINGNFITLYIENGNTFTCNTSDQILISSWSRGTQAIFEDYFSSSDHGSMSNNANTNVIRLDLSGDYSISRNGVTANGAQQLVSYPGKNYIVFNQWGGTTFDTRKITAVNNVSGTV